MAKLTSLNFLISPYPPMNKEVTFSFLFPFSLIEVLLHNTIFYHKIEKDQICQMPPARAPRILCCTWSIHMCCLWCPKKSRLVHFHVSTFVMGYWMNYEQMPISQFSETGPRCYSKESVASKTYNSFVQAAGLSSWDMHTQVCKNYYLTVIICTSPG